MRIDPYLNFEGRCEEAIDFYKAGLGAEVQMMMRYSDSPEPQPSGRMPPGTERKIMHASLLIGGALVMMSDGHCTGSTGFKGFTLSLNCADEAEAHHAFNALATEGQVIMPMGKTFWTALFGMVNDKFGVSWMVSLPGQ